MINPTIETLTIKILKNEPDFTRLSCHIFSVDEGMHILNAVKRNRYLTESRIEIQENAVDFMLISLIKRSIQFRIEENAQKQSSVVKTMQFFGRMQDIRNHYFHSEIMDASRDDFVKP